VLPDGWSPSCGRRHEQPGRRGGWAAGHAGGLAGGELADESAEGLGQGDWVAGAGVEGGLVQQPADQGDRIHWGLRLVVRPEGRGTLGRLEDQFGRPVPLVTLRSGGPATRRRRRAAPPAAAAIPTDRCPRPSPHRHRHVRSARAGPGSASSPWSTSWRGRLVALAPSANRTPKRRNASAIWSPSKATSNRLGSCCWRAEWRRKRTLTVKPKPVGWARMPMTATAASSVRAMSSSTGTTPGSTLAGGPSQTGWRYSTSARESDGGRRWRLEEAHC
jgi:hypothetical protein